MISSAAVAIWRALTAFGRVVGWPRSFRRTSTRAPCATRFAESDAPDFDISAGQQPATGVGAPVGADILRNLATPDVALARIAANHGMSTRYVQRLLEMTGTSFTGFVREQRLLSA